MLCPICNGLERLAVNCPTCTKPANDLGRAIDYTAPYAPYQPDDADTYAESMMSGNGIASLSCSHMLYCGECEATFGVDVQQWPVNEVAGKGGLV